jgi:hypothetical protein
MPRKKWYRKLLECLNPAEKIIAIIIGAGVIIGTLIKVTPIVLSVLLGACPLPAPPDQTRPPPAPKGIVIFEANWYEPAPNLPGALTEKQEAPFRVNLRKVGIGIPDAEVEQDLVYSKPHDDVVEGQYMLAKDRQGKEIAMHLLIAGEPLQMGEYGDGYVFLRIKPLPLKNNSNVQEQPVVAFRLDLRFGDQWVKGYGSSTSNTSNVELHRASGWYDFWIPLRGYLDRFPTGSEGALSQVQILFGSTHGSPPEARFWLNTIRLVKERKS